MPATRHLGEREQARSSRALDDASSRWSVEPRSTATGHVSSPLGFIRAALLVIATLWLTGPIPGGLAGEGGFSAATILRVPGHSAEFRTTPAKPSVPALAARLIADLADDPEDDAGYSAEPHAASIRSENHARGVMAAAARPLRSVPAHLATGPPLV